MSSFKGPNVVVTGGAKGIGRAIALRFLDEGLDVSIIDNDEDALGRMLGDLDMRSRAHGYVCDVSDRVAAERLYDEHLQGTDVLVNNAGGGIDFTVKAPDYAAWERTLGTNLNGAAYLTSRAAQDMIGRGAQGSIIFINSVHTAQGFKGEAAYDAAKHGVIGLMRVTALDLAPHGIRVNAVSPGGIYPAGRNTDMPLEEVTELGKRVPMGRFGTPDEIARVCTFLASDAASYITGAEIRVDGGLSIRNALF